MLARILRSPVQGLVAFTMLQGGLACPQPAFATCSQSPPVEVFILCGHSGDWRQAVPEASATRR
jgi:hypothetical protein